MVKLVIENDSTEAEVLSRYIFHLNPNIEKAVFGKKQKQPNGNYIIFYKIPVGTTEFKYKGVDFTATRCQIGKPKAMSYSVGHYEEIILENNLTNYDLFSELLIDSKKFNDKKDSKEIICHFFKGGNWHKLNEIPKRNKNSLFLPNNDLDNLIVDIDKFLSNKEEYHKYGIPFKRNYLLTGSPGTGKTSTICIVASILDMDLATLSLGSETSDAEFIRAVNTIPPKTIFVIEDIDNLFNKNSEGLSNRLTFSSLTNCLDGILKKDGLIIFMTANNPESIDEIVLRDGRIDYSLRFKDKSEEQIKQMLKLFYTGSDNDTINNFTEEIILSNFSMSSLQKFCFENRERKLSKEMAKEFLKSLKNNNFKANLDYFS